MIGYLDLASGVSGDMLLGCLVDAGWGVEALRGVVSRLALDHAEWSIDARNVMRGPVRATLVGVRAPEGHHHRGLVDIRHLIRSSDLPISIADRAIAVFERLARAEARVHGTTPDHIHFHEVGAVDAIIDIVGTVAGLDALGIERLFASPLPMGSGWAETAHGRIPMPAPATLELLSEANAPIVVAPGPGEWVTPTGAALVGELATFSQPAMRLERIGTGAGQREADWPNVARLWLGRLSDANGFVQVDTNIDDMNPQLYGAVAERLSAVGARDVWLTPVQMKKGRPGVVLSVIAPASAESAVANVLFRETTTLGVRVHTFSARHETRHEMREVMTPFGRIAVKVKWVSDTPVGASPEYEACAAAARVAGASVKSVLEAAGSAAHTLLTKMAEASTGFETGGAPGSASGHHGHNHAPHDSGHDHHHAPHDHGHDHQPRE